MRKHIVAALLGIMVASSVGGPAGAEPSAPLLGPDFLFGVSTSGFQDEGYAPDSNWSRTVADNPKYQPYGNSADFLHNYEADIARAKDMNLKVFRTSVEWARVEPAPGQQDPAGWEFYDRVFAAIHAAGMRPMITLDHWVFPGWEADRGGWRNPGMVSDWLDNARRVVDRYSTYDPLWITFNEPIGYLIQQVGMGGIDPDEVSAMADKMVTAHRAIYDYIHSIRPNAMVSSNIAYIPAPTILDQPFEDRVADKLDYIGVDYYGGASIQQFPDLRALAGEGPIEDVVQPDGIYYALRYYSRKFPGRPLYIVEDGLPTDNGQPRADGWTRANFLRDITYWLQRAKADGMNVIGYNYWSLTDNYEWGKYAPRFGLYTVDITTDPTLARRPTDGVAAYRDIATTGGVPPTYTPTRPAAFCSLMDAPSSCTDPVR